MFSLTNTSRYLCFSKVKPCMNIEAPTVEQPAAGLLMTFQGIPRLFWSALKVNLLGQSQLDMLPVVLNVLYLKTFIWTMNRLVQQCFLKSLTSHIRSSTLPPDDPRRFFFFGYPHSHFNIPEPTSKRQVLIT